jgi:transposase-like protein
MGVAHTTYSQQGGTMADINATLNPDRLPNLLSDDGEGMKKLIESVLNQVLKAQMAEHFGADRHERSSDRTGYRNGYRERQLTTRVGTLLLRVPETRDGSFLTDLFRRYQRSEQPLVLALMEMVVQGALIRKVTHITEELCGAPFSKSTVSSLATGLSARVNHWRNRRLKGNGRSWDSRWETARMKPPGTTCCGISRAGDCVVWIW